MTPPIVPSAGAGFKDSFLLAGQPEAGELKTFFQEIKNLVLDPTTVPQAKSTLLQFSVSQPCQLSNVIRHQHNQR
jgi:hypothetical protein